MRIPGITNVFAAATVALSLFCGTAAADTFVIGVENIDYDPHYNGSSPEYKGFGRALLDAFAKAKGHTFDYRPLPLTRLFQELVDGKVDFKYPDNAYWQKDVKKDRNVVYSDPVVAYIDGVSVKPDRVGKGADGIKTLGIVKGFTAWDWLDAISAGKVKQAENTNFGGLVQQTLLGRVDGAYANTAVLKYQLEKVLNQPGALVYDPGLPHTESHYHLSTTRHPQLLEEFNAWMKENAELVAKLKAEYGV